MFRKYFNFKINKKGCNLNIEGGFTLVEVMVAFLVLSLVTLILVQGVMIATKANKINKTKTEAIALANNEIEEIRLRDYDEVGIVGAPVGEPPGSLESETEIDGYTIKRTITWVEEEYSYKQVEISATNDEMNREITVVTQVYPHFGEGGPPGEPYPPVTNLDIDGIWLLFLWVDVQLTWDEPDTETPVNYYEVYRDGSLDDTTYNTSYSYGIVFGYHEYYIVVLYDDGQRSEPSETISTDDI